IFGMTSLQIYRNWLMKKIILKFDNLAKGGVFEDFSPSWLQWVKISTSLKFVRFKKNVRGQLPIYF
ncbi:hypothetical protein, partial [Bartonella sp. CL43QHWL]|uniref:hypothetical protein n=1 Tax=Bartonella sp. CL43QHWL TaxID=3243532 RepID=UPI0035CF53F2